MENYPLIDVHGHLLPYNKAQAEDAKREGFVFLEERDGNLFMDKKPRVADLPRQVDIEFYDPEKRIALLDRYGISRQTILPVPITLESSRNGDEVLEYHRRQNDQKASIARSYSRFIPFCCVPMQSLELTVEELKRCKEELGMTGVEINTQIGDLQLDNPILFPIFETIQNLNLAVFAHPWDMKGTNNNWAQHICEMPYLTHVAVKSFIDGGIL